MAAPGFEYFDSTQAGAPVLQGAAGSLIGLLDWLLVGKGGWEKPFTGTNLAVYRSLTGNRHYLRVDDTQAVYSRLRMYRSMTAVSTGTNQYPTNAQAGNINLWGITKRYSGSPAAAQRYWGIRTNRYFVLVIGRIGDIAQTTYEYRTPYVVGDVPSLAEGDSHNSFICMSPNSDVSGYSATAHEMFPGSPTVNNSFTASPITGAVSGNPSGTVLSPLCVGALPFGTAANAAYSATYAIGNRLSLAPIRILCTDSPTASNHAYLRATIPNLSQFWGVGSLLDNPLYPCQDLTAFNIGSRTFLPILIYNLYPNDPTQESSQPGILLEKTDTDGAL